MGPMCYFRLLGADELGSNRTGFELAIIFAV